MTAGTGSFSQLGQIRSLAAKLFLATTSWVLRQKLVVSTCFVGWFWGQEWNLWRRTPFGQLGNHIALPQHPTPELRKKCDAKPIR